MKHDPITDCAAGHQCDGVAADGRIWLMGDDFHGIWAIPMLKALKPLIRHRDPSTATRFLTHKPWASFIGLRG
jgi:hypothetical protein